MKSIGKYQVLEELGATATGKTYQVRDAFRNRVFAVKILQTVPGLTVEAKQQFCGHLAACAELTHRHIAKVHDLGEVDEGIFVATEWLSGMNLRRFRQENPDLPLDQKLALVAQVAEGLGFAHSRDIAHGNLKPSNIFVDASRDVGILDFGIAKWLAALLEAGSAPQGLVANYLAPEQVLGQAFDTRADIFALGLMLYEFASGKYPFSGDPGVIPREIVHSDPQPLRTLDPKIPEDLEQLVARALKKDPKERLQTAEEFASGLYLAAQQLRRGVVASMSAPPAPAQTSVETSAEPAAEPAPEPAIHPVVYPPPPAPAPEPAGQQPGMAVPMSLVPDAPAPAAGQKVRERPQDAEPAARPWSARSYAAGSSRPPSPSSGTPVPRQAAAPPPGQHPTTSAAPPAFEPPQSFLRPAAPPREPVQRKGKGNKTTKRVLTAAIGLVLAALIVSSLISRQNLRASQNKSHAITALKEPIAPVAKPSPAAAAIPEMRAAKAAGSEPDDSGKTQISARQTLNGPVRSLWEAGRYAQAMTLVDQVLAQDPDNDDARAWRKRIRAAQAAEAALK
jgi:eukaryotic-like serine/threonine-protein kinase